MDGPVFPVRWATTAPHAPHHTTGGDDGGEGTRQERVVQPDRLVSQMPRGRPSSYRAGVNYFSRVYNKNY